jgi:putative two-component system response regulator
MACQIALCHHEHWDGSGYPQGLSGESIPEAARIVSIVDVYDALSHDRVYRPAMSQEKIAEVMQQSAGSQFDPGLWGLFLTVHAEIEEISHAHPDQADESAEDALMLIAATPSAC